MPSVGRERGVRRGTRWSRLDAAGVRTIGGTYGLALSGGFAIAPVGGRLLSVDCGDDRGGPDADVVGHDGDDGQRGGRSGAEQGEHRQPGSARLGDRCGHGQSLLGSARAIGPGMTNAAGCPLRLVNNGRVVDDLQTAWSQDRATAPRALGRETSVGSIERDGASVSVGATPRVSCSTPRGARCRS